MELDCTGLLNEEIRKLNIDTSKKFKWTVSLDNKDKEQLKGRQEITKSVSIKVTSGSHDTLWPFFWSNEERDILIEAQEGSKNITITYIEHKRKNVLDRRAVGMAEVVTNKFTCPWDGQDWKEKTTIYKGRSKQVEGGYKPENESPKTVKISLGGCDYKTEEGIAECSLKAVT